MEEWADFFASNRNANPFLARAPWKRFSGITGAGSFRPGTVPVPWSGGLSFHSAWEQGLKPFPLQEDEKARLQKWGDELGGSDTQGQMVLCSAMRAEAEERKTKARKEAVEKSRMIRTLSLCAGAAVILLLL